MRVLNEKLCADILETGRKEFLALGYRDASLRHIAASLGVTTGLSTAIMRTKRRCLTLWSPSRPKSWRIATGRYSRPLLSRAWRSRYETSPNTRSRVGWMLDFIYDHFDAFKLIACCAGGTKYEHYLDTLAEIEDNAGRALIEKMAEAGYSLPQIDDELIHIMSSALFNGIFETVRHDMPREKALRYMASLRDFYSAGWFKLLGISDT